MQGYIKIVCTLIFAVGFLTFSYLPFNQLIFLQEYQLLLNIHDIFRQLLLTTLPLTLIGSLALFMLYNNKKSSDSNVNPFLIDKTYTISIFCLQVGIAASFLTFAFALCYSLGFINHSSNTAPWSDEELARIAVHETGHVLIREIEYPGSTIKAEIIAPSEISKSHGWFNQPLPSGYVLGEKASRLLTKEDIEKNIRIYLGGLAAEKLIYPEDQWYTSSSDDLEIVKNLVITLCNNGLSSSGPVTWEVLTPEERSILYKEIVDKQYDLVYENLQQHRQELLLISEQLKEHKVLTGNQIQGLLN